MVLPSFTAFRALQNRRRVCAVRQDAGRDPQSVKERHTVARHQGQRSRQPSRFSSLDQKDQ